MHSDGRAVLTVNGESPVDLSILQPTYGRACLDIRALGARNLRFAYDAGFASTAVCKSAIAFVGSDSGELLYRGYPVGQLAEQCDFLEVAYLLREGDLPTVQEKQAFAAAISRHAALHEQMVKLYQGFRRDARPMAVVVGVVGALSAFHPQGVDLAQREQRSLSFQRLLAKLPAIVAIAYKYSIGWPFMAPRADLGYAANFLYMLFASPCAPWTPDPVQVCALDRLLIVHAEQGQDAAAATVRMAGSSGANPFACISAAITCASGPAQSGAGEACIRMLREIGDVTRLAAYIARIKEGAVALPTAGFTDTVFQATDPRIKLVRDLWSDELAELRPGNRRLFALARAVEDTLLSDPYFTERKLSPNLHFYSAVVLQALSIPPDLFACVHAVSRTVGWLAHWEEMLIDPEYRIARPRQLYTGSVRRGLPATQ